MTKRSIANCGRTSYGGCKAALLWGNRGVDRTHASVQTGLATPAFSSFWLQAAQIIVSTTENRCVNPMLEVGWLIRWDIDSGFTRLENDATGIDGLPHFDLSLRANNSQDRSVICRQFRHACVKNGIDLNLICALRCWL
jgi:hypothetical protein